MHRRSKRSSLDPTIDFVSPMQGRETEGIERPVRPSLAVNLEGPKIPFHHRDAARGGSAGASGVATP